MDASKDFRQDCLDRVKALGTEVVPEVRPIRNVDSGRPVGQGVVRGHVAGLGRPVQPLADFLLQLCRPRRVQDGALPLAGHCRGEPDSEVNGVAFRQDGDSFGAGHGGRCGVAELSPAQAPAGHHDGGVVGAFIGPALDSDREKASSQLYRPALGSPLPCKGYCDFMSFNDNVQLDPSQVQDRRGMGRGGQSRRRHRRRARSC